MLLDLYYLTLPGVSLGLSVISPSTAANLTGGLCFFFFLFSSGVGVGGWTWSVMIVAKHLR